MSSDRERELAAELTAIADELRLPAHMRPLYIELTLCLDRGNSPEDARDYHGVLYAPDAYYDEVWDRTFGGDEHFSRTAGTERVRRWCDERDITYVETLDAFREKTADLDHWLHWHKDAHPTAEGHELIADVLLRSGTIVRIRGLLCRGRRQRPRRLASRTRCRLSIR